MERAINIYFEPKNEPFDVTLLLESNAIIYFERKPIKGQYLKKNSDGTAELTISVTHKEEVFYILKKWLPQIKVIEPYALQEEFERMMQKYLDY
jgi:predicted DNA-binding transcriptional regulator YafY